MESVAARRQSPVKRAAIDVVTACAASVTPDPERSRRLVRNLHGAAVLTDGAMAPVQVTHRELRVVRDDDVARPVVAAGTVVTRVEVKATAESDCRTVQHKRSRLAGDAISRIQVARARHGSTKDRHARPSVRREAGDVRHGVGKHDLRAVGDGDPPRRRERRVGDERRAVALDRDIPQGRHPVQRERAVARPDKRVVVRHIALDEDRSRANHKVDRVAGTPDAVDAVLERQRVRGIGVVQDQFLQMIGFVAHDERDGVVVPKPHSQRMAVGGEARDLGAGGHRHLAARRAERPRERVVGERTVRAAVEDEVVRGGEPLPEIGHERTFVDRERTAPVICSRERERRGATLRAAVRERQRRRFDEW